MELTEIYREGEAALRVRDIGVLLDAVESGFVPVNDRRVIDRFTFRQCCIGGTEPRTGCEVLGVTLATPVIMSAMTMPIPAIVENGLLAAAEGLKAAGSLMWVGTPIPQNLKEIVATGVPLAANVKPFEDRKRMFAGIEEIQKSGVRWMGVEIDAGQGTKVGDRQMAKDCRPLSLSELKEIRKAVSIPLIFKGVLSRADAEASMTAGADAIFISNHGAHTIDYLPHPFQVMDDIMEAARGNVEVIVDSGMRRGSDVMKGLAFGASLVGIGRPILFGLAADGRRGVTSVVDQITGELRRIMSMLGVETPQSAVRDLLIEA